ncbi:hypothetical protein KY320_01980, partial [Candidatus Woesearchaeota archaeon]|nr:hypothetical protein [Candidatus Woesearchaeota archaeon]
MNLGSAIPQPAVEFYGNVSMPGSQAVPGIVIWAYDGQGVVCGNFTIVNEGYYGLLSCNGDDDATSEDEGALQSENITFKINTTNAMCFGDYSWDSGEFKEVNLRTNYAPVLTPIGSQLLTAGVNFEIQIIATDPDNDVVYFYDNTAIFEIGLLSGVINFTPLLNNTGGHSTEITASDGFLNDSMIMYFTVINGSCGDNLCSIYESCSSCPEDCGACSSALGAGATEGGGAEEEEGGYSRGGIDRYLREAGEKEECVEEWVCSEWSECYVNLTQLRNCYDNNYCGTIKDKPAVVMGCELGSCFDGIKNCHDGGCEEGVDCGGPCPDCVIFEEGEAYARPFEEKPRPVCGDQVCEDGENCLCPSDCRDASKFPWWIFLLIILGVTVGMIAVNSLTYYLQQKSGESQEFVKIREKVYLTWIVVVALLLLLAIYCYLLWWCWPYIVGALTLTVIILTMLVVLGVVVYQYTTRYEEEKNRERLRNMMRMHLKQLKEVIDIQGKLVQKIENRYVRKIYEMYKAKHELLRELPQITKIYNKMRELQLKREKGEQIIEVESVIVAAVSNLEENEVYKSMLEKSDELKEIDEELKHIIDYLARKHALIENVKKIRGVLN